MEEYVESTLDNGAILRLVDISTFLTIDAMGHYGELALPEEPGLVDIPTKVGVEHRPAREGDPLYDEWKVKADEVDEQRSQFLQDFPWQEGVLSWKLADGKKFVSQPPKAWKVPSRYAKYGVTFSPLLDTRKLYYVRYVVCEAVDDYWKVWRIINSSMLISQGEVDDAVATFQGDTSPPTVEGSAG